MIRASIAGGSGYVGGELARWIDQHPVFELGQITSERSAGQAVWRTHPHLRHLTAQRFVPLDALESCDLLLCALPHGALARRIEALSTLAPRLVDCSADFRLGDAETYRRWYAEEHVAPQWLERFTYGLPEVNRDAIAGAQYVSGVGCNATAIQLALLPLVRAGIVDPRVPVIADVKVGSSEGGASSSAASHHPVRSGCVRTFSATGHRHTAEVERTFGALDVHMTVTSIEMVRGALATCHATLAQDVDEREVLRSYRRFAVAEPFVDVVVERAGSYRLPEPKLVAGTNRAQIGFGLDAKRRRIVALCAIDNLGKGAAGTAIQAANLACGLDETSGLTFRGLHPA